VPQPAPFEGFRAEAIAFLANLAANNDRGWFTPRKTEYEELVKRPLEALGAALAERFTARGLPLTADPAHSPFRVYRDVRFSKDKSPYKPYASAQFPMVGGGPAGYVHIEPGEIFAGGGLWRPEPSALARWRHLVVADPARVRAAVKAPGFTVVYGAVDGDRLVRVPTGYPKDSPDADLLRLKDIVFRRRLADADVMSPGLPDLLADSYEAAMPVFKLLADIAAG
jgi:uncharacterized protein (TIGR02453 family)